MCFHIAGIYIYSFAVNKYNDGKLSRFFPHMIETEKKTKKGIATVRMNLSKSLDRATLGLLRQRVVYKNDCSSFFFRFLVMHQ